MRSSLQGMISVHTEVEEFLAALWKLFGLGFRWQGTSIAESSAERDESRSDSALAFRLCVIDSREVCQPHSRETSSLFLKAFKISSKKAPDKVLVRLLYITWPRSAVLKMAAFL